LISAAFPVAAGLSHHTESFPGWWGAVDVGIALALAILAISVAALAQKIVTPEVELVAYSVYRVVIHAVLVVLAVVFVVGDRLAWVNCLTGFAWRYWLLLYILPSWIALAIRN